MKNEIETSIEWRLWLNANEHLHNWNSEKIAKLYHKQQSILSEVGVTLPTYKETNIELKNRIEDIKDTSSACENTDIHLGFKLGFIECYEWIKSTGN